MDPPKIHKLLVDEVCNNFISFVNLKEIKFSDYFNEELFVGSSFNKQLLIDVLPNNLKILILGFSFN